MSPHSSLFPPYLLLPSQPLNVSFSAIPKFFYGPWIWWICFWRSTFHGQVLRVHMQFHFLASCSVKDCVKLCECLQEWDPSDEWIERHREVHVNCSLCLRACFRFKEQWCCRWCFQVPGLVPAALYINHTWDPMLKLWQGTFSEIDNHHAFFFL